MVGQSWVMVEQIPYHINKEVSVECRWNPEMGYVAPMADAKNACYLHGVQLWVTDELEFSLHSGNW